MEGPRKSTKHATATHGVSLAAWVCAFLFLKKSIGLSCPVKLVLVWLPSGTELGLYLPPVFLS